MLFTSFNLNDMNCPIYMIYDIIRFLLNTHYTVYYNLK